MSPKGYWAPLRSLSTRGTLPIFILFFALAINVTYGVVTYNTPYGCSTAPSQITQSPQTTEQPARINRQVLANPCFYIYYFGIVGGSTLVILIIPVPKKTALSGNKE